MVAATLFVGALHFVRFGYDFGSSDQDEIVPAALHAADAEVLASDWFVSTQAAAFNVRTPVVLALATLEPVVGIAAAALLFYLVSVFLLVYGTASVAHDSSPTALAVFGAPLLLLVLTPRFTLGGNDLSHSIFVPSMLAWGLVLLALHFLIARRPFRAAILFGLATVVQPLVGVLGAAICTVSWSIERLSSERVRTALRDLLLVGVVAFLVSSPVLFPIIRSQLVHTSGVPGSTVFEILTSVRAPHHYLPSAFPARSFVDFGVLLLAGLVAIWLSPSLRSHRALFVCMLGAILAACLIYVVGVEFARSPTVAKLQLFRLTVLAKSVAGIAVVASAADAIDRSRLGDRIRRLLQPRRALLMSCLVAVVVAAVTALTPLLDDRVAFLARKQSAWPELYRWAKEQTPADAVFAVPPSDSEMRSRARRAIVVNFKAFAFQDPLMVAWRDRLYDMAPTPASFEPPVQLDARFEALGDARLTDLSAKYGFSYVVRRTPLPAADSAAHWEIRRVFYPPSAAAETLRVYGRRATHSSMEGDETS